MQAPWVKMSTRLSAVGFDRTLPQLVQWGFHVSPIESVMIGLTENKNICRIEFARGRSASVILLKWQKAWRHTKFEENEKLTRPFAEQLLKKGSGKAVSLHLFGTSFQIRVWKELLLVKSGETVSYAELAKRIKHPKAVRAVANAMGANPVPFLVPCHRVIATGGGLGGFGGGLTLKRMLLAAEGVEAA